MTVGFINLSKPRITWEENLNAGLSTLGWSCGYVCGVSALIKLVKLI